MGAFRKMFAIRALSVAIVLVQLSQFYAIDTRPNSLSGSLAKIGAQPEAKVCKRTWSLPKESSDLLEVSLALDSLLANTNEKIEKLYVVIGKLLKVINLEKKLDKQLRRIYLDALQSLITLLNKMYYYMQAQLVGLDATLTTIIILQVSSLNWVSGLDCKCACPIPKLGCELTQSTADALKECTVTERDALVDLLDTACNDLNTVLKHGLKKAGIKITEVDINLNVSVLKVFRESETCKTEVVDQSLAAGLELLDNSRTCWKEKS